MHESEEGQHDCIPVAERGVKLSGQRHDGTEIKQSHQVHRFAVVGAFHKGVKSLRYQVHRVIEHLVRKRKKLPGSLRGAGGMRDKRKPVAFRLVIADRFIFECFKQILHEDRIRSALEHMVIELVVGEFRRSYAGAAHQ